MLCGLRLFQRARVPVLAVVVGALLVWLLTTYVDTTAFPAVHPETRPTTTTTTTTTTPMSARQKYINQSDLIYDIQQSRFTAEAAASTSHNNSKRQDHQNHLALMRSSSQEETSWEFLKQGSDGRWFSRHEPFRIFAYSAFFDARPTLALLLGAKVRVIIVAETPGPEQQPLLYCRLLGGEQDADTVVEGEPGPIGRGMEAAGTYFTEFILSCPVPLKARPRAVAVLVRPQERDNALLVPVEYPAHGSSARELAVCVSVSFGSQEPSRLVEWLEMQRLLGVSKVVIYNNSLDAAASHVMEFYARQGLVELRQSRDFLSAHGNASVLLHMSPVINDCMYRHLYTHRKIAVIDLDEVIVPRFHADLPTLLAHLDHKFPSAKSYVFRNAYFFLDWAPEAAQPAELVFLGHQRRMQASPRNYAVKSIVEPLWCSHMHNHKCLHFTGAARRSKQQEVSPGLALSHHYKHCHFDSYYRKPGLCDHFMRHPFTDRTVLRYRDSLTKAVRAALGEIGRTSHTPLN